MKRIEIFFIFSAPLEKELVCEIKKIQDENPCDVTKSRDVIIINVSPIEIGHCLLVPSLEQNLPQILNEYSIRLALQVMASSGRSNFKMAFNSLCAYASVNHLHWHMYYLQVIHLWIIFKIYYKCLSAWLFYFIPIWIFFTLFYVTDKFASGKPWLLSHG